MSLKFNSSDKTSLISQNSITQAYKSGWNFVRFGGSYSSGKNFFSIHWEVNSSSANLVRFHVEAPTEKEDKNLNDLKYQIVNEIKNNLHEAESLIKEGQIVESVRASKEKNIKNDKSSEVFHVVLDDSYDYKKVKEGIILVNKNLRGFLDQYIQKHSERFKKLNLKDKY